MKIQLRQLEPKINVNPITERLTYKPKSPTMKPRNMSEKINKGGDKIEMLTIEPKINAFFANPDPNFKQKLRPNPTHQATKKTQPKVLG
jgi:hypothetical protein